MTTMAPVPAVAMELTSVRSLAYFEYSLAIRFSCSALVTSMLWIRACSTTC